MNDRVLLVLGGVAAILAGVLRAGSSFIPWEANNLNLEILAFAIDVLLLFGFMAIYLGDRVGLGFFGLVFFVPAEIGIASIVGPDTVAFGIDTYQVGAALISISLALFALVMLATRAGSQLGAVFWILSAVAGVGGTLTDQAAVGIPVAGAFFGIGFIAAGAALLSRRDAD
jgi:hypothetical protein